MTITTIPTPAYIENAMQTYGWYTNEDRAIPDIRDGLKPVQRRILFSMYKSGAKPDKPYIKSAYIVGYCLGHYHPHSDSSIYQAMVLMANSANPLVDGYGNWGDDINDDPAGAFRYTNCRLSKFAQKVFFDPRYLPVMQTVDNYDGKEKEPFVLPALLPNALLNGASGIGVGVTTNIPSFQLKSITALLKAVLKRGSIRPTPKECLKHLKLAAPNGFTIKTDGAIPANLIVNGVDKVIYYPTFTINPAPDKKSFIILVDGFPPRTKLPKLVEKLRSSPNYVSVNNISSKKTGPALELITVSGINKVDIEDTLTKIISSSIKYNICLTNRVKRVADFSDSDVPEMSFKLLPIPDLIETWLKWRIKLEQLAINYRIREIDKLVINLDLMLLAADKKEIILQILSRKTTDLTSSLAKALNISVENADFILRMAVRKLSLMDSMKTKQEKQVLLKEMVELKSQLNNILNKVLLETSALEAII